MTKNNQSSGTAYLINYFNNTLQLTSAFGQYFNAYREVYNKYPSLKEGEKEQLSKNISEQEKHALLNLSQNLSYYGGVVYILYKTLFDNNKLEKLHKELKYVLCPDHDNIDKWENFLVIVHKSLKNEMFDNILIKKEEIIGKVFNDE